ncbi:MAG TPA: hypothetical protein V6C81_08945 [Planktothrix sp.]|jgi:hypothetical protein
MSVVSKEQILRLNCPGYGEENYLSIGKAKSLDQYSVIVANPVSILHLFDKDQDSVKDIDAKLSEGLTSYTLKGDDLLHQLESDLKKRIFELVSFLERGGLLVYFLCRPFMVQGPSLAMDNYYWLESLAPDTPTETNVRHMSAVSHGRIVEPSDQAEKSEFASYFKQNGIEWSTIIRTDFLTEGYIVLATAGPRKCIAAHLIAGDNGGRILFLPAPYSPDFDRTLIECVNEWYTRKVGGGVGEAPPPMQQAAPAPAKIDSAGHEAAAALAAEDEPVLLEPEPLPAMAAPQPTMFAGVDDSKSMVSSAPLEAPPPPVPVSRLNPARNSSTNLPPVPKFSATTSRPMPGVSLVPEDAEPRRQGMTAEEILDGVSQQSEKSPDAGEPGVFDERTTAEISTAFSALNVPHDPNLDSSGSASDLLKELESMSPVGMEMPPRAELDSPPAMMPGTPEPLGEPTPEAPPEEAPRPSTGGRNLLQELQSATGDHTESGRHLKPEPFAPPQNESNSFFESLSSAAAAKRSYNALPSSDPAPAAAEPLTAPVQKWEPTPEPAPAANAGADAWKPTQDVPVVPEYQFGVTEPAASSRSASEKGEQAQEKQRNTTELPDHSPDNNKSKVSSSETFAEQKDLIKRMEVMTKTAAPDWCTAFTFSDLEELKQERDSLNDTIRQTQARISAIENKITMLEGLKNALLSAEGEELQEACSRVFKRIGWSAQASQTDESELLLNGGDRVEVIARLVRSNGQAPRADIAHLAQSVLTFWGETEIEPKGILVACTWVNRPPSERTESDFSEALAEFAQKKSLCLMTTMQLLCMYRDLELGKVANDEIRRRIIDTNGKLGGFHLDAALNRAAV